MRIALVSLHTSPGSVPGTGDAGGMNVVVAEHARALSARGHDVHVVTRATGDLAPGERPLDPDGNGAGPHLHAICGAEPNLRKEDLPARLPLFARALEQLGPFDAVHAHYWLSGIAALPLASASGVRLAISFHTVAAQKNALLAPGDRREPPARVAAERALTHNATVIAGSRSELDTIVEHYGSPGHGSEVIHPGVDTVLFRPRSGAGSGSSGSSSAGPSSAGPSGAGSSTAGSSSAASGDSERGAPLSDRALHRLTVLGRVQPFKGQDLALRAAAEVARRDPDLWARSELIIAGEPTPGAEGFAAHLRDMAREFGIAERVRFLPAQSRAESAALLASSTVVIVPSHSETFGLVALEAAACGVPTVVGSHTGLMESAPENISALHVEGRDPVDWARAIATLLRDPKRSSRLGARAREFALRHSWDAQAAKLERIYRAATRTEMPRARREPSSPASARPVTS